MKIVLILPDCYPPAYCGGVGRPHLLEWAAHKDGTLLLTPDFLIIGGGVIGCATALELAAPGVRVALLERTHLGAESSWAGAGLLYPLLPWDYREEVTSLTTWGRALYPEWIGCLKSESGFDPQYHESGLLVLPPYDRDKALAWAAAHHESMAEVSPRLVEPALTHAGPALWLPQVAQVRNPRLIQALHAALAKRGVVVHEQAEIRGFQVRDHVVAGVATSDGRIFAAGSYIVAAGAWTAQLLGALGESLQIAPVRGQMLLYKIGPSAVHRMVLADGTYLIPRQDGHVLVGSTLESVGFDKSVTEEAQAALRQKAEAILPCLKGVEPVRQWAGLRPGSPDNIPAIGRHPEIGNLWVSSGHFRYGVTMAPASARLLGDLLLGRQCAVDPAPYAWPAA